MKILIGYDGSGCADAAIDELRRAGLPEAAEALIVSVAEVWLPPPADENGAENPEVAGASSAPAAVQQMWARREQIVEQARDLAGRAAHRVSHNFPHWTVRHEALSGSPSWELLRLAGDWQPDLVIVGSHGRTALGRFVLGSVSQRVLTESRCSVRIARGETPVGELPQRIVIGVDGSASSFAAVRAVAARRWMAGSEAHVVVVYDALMPSALGSIGAPSLEAVYLVNDEEQGRAGQIAAQAAAQLRDANLTVSTFVAEGNPKQLLLEHAEKRGADSIFVGSTGFSSRIDRFLLGSVSAAVAARAHCSVEVVRGE
ncbi:MAG TPA: universal stress protein [Pyrinomonadaceae bacterium]